MFNFCIWIEIRIFWGSCKCWAKLLCMNHLQYSNSDIGSCFGLNIRQNNWIKTLFVKQEWPDLIVLFFWQIKGIKVCQGRFSCYSLPNGARSESALKVVTQCTKVVSTLKSDQVYHKNVSLFLSCKNMNTIDSLHHVKEHSKINSFLQFESHRIKTFLKFELFQI